MRVFPILVEMGFEDSRFSLGNSLVLGEDNAQNDAQDVTPASLAEFLPACGTVDDSLLQRLLTAWGNLSVESREAVVLEAERQAGMA